MVNVPRLVHLVHENRVNICALATRTLTHTHTHTHILIGLLLWSAALPPMRVCVGLILASTVQFLNGFAVNARLMVFHL